MTILKQGRFTREELFQIEHLSKSGLAPDAIAQKLSRSVKSILDRVEFISDDKNLDIRNTEQWPVLKKQFDLDEQHMFIYHWKEMIAQFREDVPHTEKMQIIDLIKVEIIMNRLMIKEKEQKEDIDRMRVDIEVEKNKEPLDQDTDLIWNYEKQIGFAIAAQVNVTKSFEGLLKEKKQMLAAMKATREQRIKRIEDSKETIVGWTRNLLLNDDVRVQVGIDMEKMRLAMNVEAERLSEWHTYEDGTVDQAFLTPETVMNDQGHVGPLNKEK